MEILAEMKILIITELFDGPCIFIGEKNGERDITMEIDTPEVVALYHLIRRIKTPRPMTHKLIASVVQHMGGKIQKLVVSDFVHDCPYSGTCIGTLVLETNGKTIEIDCRPGDGLVLARLANAPIFIEDKVFDEVEEMKENMLN